jgi:hypothetical protein
MAPVFPSCQSRLCKQHEWETDFGKTIGHNLHWRFMAVGFRFHSKMGVEMAVRE